ncbi:lyase family protein [Parvularcula marina]|uniref:Adenylosuccinate lyase C-terminal domain-containing protein n=1 Tax=Parvularcula marina TaxID=2292771 RepID=A0A371RI61_9PROT|nr:lyase family protein [Parvularcula marina]RFB05149.1 hypothetical protein DX908_07715 [Parvularcula marina]
MMNSLISGWLLILASSSSPSSPQTVEDVFTPEHRNMLVMQVEAAIANAQADHGVISRKVAREIGRTATLEYAPLDEVAAEYKIVRHRMVALLNVWRRSLSPEAQNALHFGATTVDIYDTVRILQVRESIGLLREDMLAVEALLVELAREYRDTPMIGRTLGQHALPITFGKKASVWAAANRRNIERLNDMECRLVTLGVFRGAVGTHLGLGPKGIEIENSVAESLGLGPVTPADWHGMRDVFGEYASVLSISSRTYSKIGEEIFFLQSTDIGEVYERRASTAISSSTMPHKRNPSRSEALIHWGRVIPAEANILMDDIANAFERDNTSRPNSTIEDLSVDAAEMMDDLESLLERLEVEPDRMAENLGRTDGMILAQRIVFALQEDVGKEAAEAHVTEAARASLTQGLSFRESLLADPEIGPYLTDNIDELLDPSTYLGLSAEQADETIAWLASTPATPVCGETSAR